LEHKILLCQLEDLGIASDFLPPTCNHTHEIIRLWQPRKIYDKLTTQTLTYEQGMFVKLWKNVFLYDG